MDVPVRMCVYDMHCFKNGEHNVDDTPRVEKKPAIQRKKKNPKMFSLPCL